MRLCTNTFEEFESKTKDKKLIAFAPSQLVKLATTNYRDLRLDEKIDYFVDNDADKWEALFELSAKSIEIHSIEKLLAENLAEIVVLICSSAYAIEIYNQLEAIDLLKETECFFLPYMIAERSDNHQKNLLDASCNTEQKIPQIIHCFWFSKDEKDGLSKRCLESWRNACPDYQVMEWNADNYDVSKNPYMKKAFEMKKWAFVSDYARLDVIYQMGGFYFDLDVELYQNIDCLRKHEFVIGYGPYRDVEGAAFGAVAGNKFVHNLLEIYAQRNFSWKKILEGDIQPVYFNRIFSGLGFAMDGQYEERDGICIYPKEVFSDRNPFTEEVHKGEFALGVHHCAGGWWSKRDRIYHEKSLTAMKEIEKLYQNEK